MQRGKAPVFYCRNPVGNYSEQRRSSERSERSERPERSERRERPRREDADYDLPPVQSATTSLADLFAGFTASDDEEK